MNVLLHPTINPHEAKRIASENGCLLVMDGSGRLRLKQKRLRRGLDGFDMKAIRHAMTLANRSFAHLARGEWDEARAEIRNAIGMVDVVLEEPRP